MSTVNPDHDQQPTVTAEARAAANVRRRRVLLWSAPVMLLLLLFGVKSISMVAVNESGRGAYSAGDHDSATRQFDRLGLLNLFQWWIAPYNHGTALYQTGDLDRAESELQIALDRAPQDKSCQIAINLSRVLEAQGDQLGGQGRHAEAQEKYTAALKVLADHRCDQSGDGQGQQQQQQEQQQKKEQAEERVNKKLEESQGQPEGEPSEEEGDPQQQPERTPQEEQRRSEEQKKRNSEGERQEQNRREMEDSENEPDRERVDKPW